MKHLLVEHYTFCRLVRGKTFTPRTAGGTYVRAEVGCPECLVALDRFVELGLKPKRSRYTEWGITTETERRGRELRIATPRWFKRVRIKFEARGKVDLPWARGSVAALAKRHNLTEGDALFTANVWSDQPAPVFLNYLAAAVDSAEEDAPDVLEPARPQLVDSETR